MTGLDAGILVRNLGWCVWPLSVIAAFTAFAAGSYLWKRVFEPEAFAESGPWELRFMAHAAGIAQLAGMLGTVAGLVLGLGKMTPGDPGTVKHLISALGTAMWTTYVGIGIALSSMMFVWIAQLLGEGGGHGTAG